MGRLHPRAHFLDVHLANGHATSSATTTTTTTLISATPASYFTLKSDIPKLQLPPGEEPTRVQLQRQRLRDQQPATQHSIVSTTIPGIRTSAAFFNSLRTNLRLHASPPPSPISTPNSMRGSAASLPPPSPLATPMAEHDVAAASEDPLAGVPELQQYPSTDPEERLDALNLVADSVAQQRQKANNILVFHPINLAVTSGIFAIVVKIASDRGFDWISAGLMCLALFMCELYLYRFLSNEYLEAAEKINWEWAGENVDVLLTKFGTEVIGACVIEWVSGDTKKRGKKAWRGLIKGWTVKLRYRHKGVGTALLEDAVKEAKKKGAESLEFADDHANSKRFLYNIYNSFFDKGDARARALLQQLYDTTPIKGKKK